MKKIILVVLSFVVAQNVMAQKRYKQMMEDVSVNFYVVCKAADAYFDTVDKFEKGSGYKGYQRWRNANEYKYYPSGRRDNVDPYFVSKAFKTFQNTTGTSRSISFLNGWNELGPFRIDSISGHYSAGLGRVEDHYVDPNDTNVMYLGSRSGGFWRTSDGGVTWLGGVTDTLMASGVNAIAVSPTNHDSVLINVRNSRNGYSHGIYRSIDGGASFTVTNFNPTTLGYGGLGSNFKIHKIVYHPTVPNLIFVGTNKGVFRTSDNFQTWTVLYPVSEITDIKFHPTNNNTVYIADTRNSNSVRNYVLVSTNQGVSYTQSAVITGNNNSSGWLSVSNDCSDCVYFASTSGVWKSTNSGSNFTFISNPAQSCLGFAVNDLDTSNMIYGYVDVMASNDGGASFNQVTWWSLGNSAHGAGNFQTRYDNSSAYVHADLHPAKCVNGTYYIGTDGSFSKSVDGGVSWEILNQGTAIRENYKLGVSQSNHYRSVSGSQDNGMSIKLRGTWLEFYGADGMEGIIHPLNDDWMLTSLQYGGRRQTKDGGQSQSGATPPNNGNAAWEAPIAYDPNNQMRVYDFRDSIYVSQDFGDSWSYLGKPSSFSGTIRQAAIAENNSSIIVVANGANIDKSTNGGISFSSIKSNLPNSTIQDIAFDPKDDNTIIVTYASYQNNNSKVYITTTGGTTWSNITYNLGNMPIHSVVIDHTDASNIYLGAEIGVYTKTMSATTWSLYNTALPNTTIEELEIVYGSNTLKAATWGRGLWEYNLVGRSSFPSVVTTTITNPPAENSPIASVDQFVTSVVSYDNTLSAVYVKWSANNLNFDSTITMINTVDSTWVSQTPLPNYSAATKMYFKVFAVGSANDTSETYKFMYDVKPFDYCAGTGNNGAGNLYISNFQVANINNTSVNDAYTMYSDSVVYLFTDSTYAISLSANTSWSSNDCAAWIDYDHNANFDTSENLGLPNFSGNLSQTSFTVPSNANTTDTLRLRARLSYWGSLSDPCGNTLGEVEDYPVLVISEPTLNFTLNSNILCQNTPAIMTYTGDPVDSIVWSFTNGSNTYTSSGFVDSINVNAVGVYNLHAVGYIHGFEFVLDSNQVITVLPSQNITNTTSSCSPNDTGLFVQSYTNTSGCDSIVTSIITLLPTDDDTLWLSSCNPLDTGFVIQNLTNGFGCDSIVTTITDLLPTDSTLLNDTTCMAANIGTTHQTLSNIYGCDSVVTTVTTIGQLNGSINASTNVLTALPAGLSYQWIDCDSNLSAIPGQIGQIFTASENGKYAVVVTNNACVDTTSCVDVTGLGLSEIDEESPLVIYPNPTSNSITIELNGRIKLEEFRIFNMIGEDVSSRIEVVSNENTKVVLDFSNVATGVYIIKTDSTINRISKQ